ncbi:MAG: hypothetical protein ABFD92_19090 [Planctomycetaceae bacterium]
MAEEVTLRHIELTGEELWEEDVCIPDCTYYGAENITLDGQAYFQLRLGDDSGGNAYVWAQKEGFKEIILSLRDMEHIGILGWVNVQYDDAGNEYYGVFVDKIVREGDEGGEDDSSAAGEGNEEEEVAEGAEVGEAMLSDDAERIDVSDLLYRHWASPRTVGAPRG